LCVVNRCRRVEIQDVVQVAVTARDRGKTRELRAPAGVFDVDAVLSPLRAVGIRYQLCGADTVRITHDTNWGGHDDACIDVRVRHLEANDCIRRRLPRDLPRLN
jgi:hypothetical protein